MQNYWCECEILPSEQCLIKNFNIPYLLPLLIVSEYSHCAVAKD